MQRFFVENIKGDTVLIEGTEAHHLKNVLRKKAGDEVLLFDGRGSEYKAKIEKIDESVVKTRIVSKIQKDIESKIKINLFQSIPKAYKFDFIVEKSTELGVSEIIPVVSERTQGDLIRDEGYSEKKLLRWKKIAVAASKQCGRITIPEILPISSFTNAVRSIQCIPKAVSIIPWECENKNNLKTVLKNFDSEIQTVNLFIGPEGGYSNSEIEAAKKNDIVPVSLGKRILRTETAPIVVISNILYELDL